MNDTETLPSQKLREYFRTPSADLERLLLEVEEIEHQLRLAKQALDEAEDQNG